MRNLFLLFALICAVSVSGQTLASGSTMTSIYDPAQIDSGAVARFYAHVTPVPVYDPVETSVETSESLTSENSSVFLVAYVGGAAARRDGDVRNGLNYGIEAHVVLKTDPDFGVDFGLGAGYTSLSLPGGANRDFAVDASVGFTDNTYVSGGVRFSYAATSGVVSPAVYLALTYPISDKVSVFTRGSIGIDVLPENEFNYTTGRGQVGVSYYPLR